MARRTREVYPTREIAHLWASGKVPTAHNPQRNLRFEGDRLFSYSTEIAVLVKKRGKAVAALITRLDYSHTTQGHKHAAERACHHIPRFHVADFTSHVVSLNNYNDRMVVIAGKAKTARDSAQRWMNSLADLVNEANKFAEFFKLAKRFAVNDFFTAQEREKVDAEIAKQPEREARREARWTAGMEELKQARLRRAELQKELLLYWLDGKPAPDGKQFPHRWDFDFAYLRVNGDNAETTMGATVPLEHVRRALPIVLRLIERHEGYVPGGKTIHLGVYELRSVSVDGVVSVGCHQFEASEVKRFAASIGIA